MKKKDLNKKLVLACEQAKPDLDEIKRLIRAGADTNQLNKYGDNIFDDVFIEILYSLRTNTKELSQTVDKIKEIIRLMVENGWNIKTFGFDIMNQFLFSTYDAFTFDIYSFMLQYELADDPKMYEMVLESIGTEESYQRCCEEDHQIENLFYAMYEMVDAKMNGKDHKSIEPYYGATGLTIDRVIYFNEEDTMSPKEKFIEYNADIGFVCGEKVLVIRNGVNILFMNDRIEEIPQTDICAIWKEEIIGKKITSISFEHRNIVKGKTKYGQPTIIIEFDNGRKLKFTHNFGEHMGDHSQSRFWME